MVRRRASVGKRRDIARRESRATVGLLRSEVQRLQGDAGEEK